MTTHDTIANAAATATYAGGSSAIIFGLSANEFAAIVGAVVAVLGLIVQIVFKVLGHMELKNHHKKIEDMQ